MAEPDMSGLVESVREFYWSESGGVPNQDLTISNKGHHLPIWAWTQVVSILLLVYDLFHLMKPLIVEYNMLLGCHRHNFVARHDLTRMFLLDICVVDVGGSNFIILG